MNLHRRTPPRGTEAGFTLVEALVAIVVLVFGLMAVTNLLLVAASSNTVANQGTAAVTTATQVLDFLKNTTFNTLDDTPRRDGLRRRPTAARTATTSRWCVTDWHCTTATPGVGHGAHALVHHRHGRRPAVVRPRAVRGHRCPRGGTLAGGVHHLPRLHQLRPADGWMPARAMTPQEPRTMRHERGFSLVELIVAMTVTLIVSSAIYGLLAVGRQRLPPRARGGRPAAEHPRRRWTSSRATSSAREPRCPPSPRCSRATTRPAPAPASLNNCGPTGTMGPAGAAGTRGRRREHRTCSRS